jgi:hypothetical protein
MSVPRISMGPAEVQARDDAIEHVTITLLPKASLVTRLIAKQARSRVGRSEGTVLRALSAGPRGARR